MSRPAIVVATLIAIILSFGSCSHLHNRYLIISEATHFAIQGNGTSLNLPIFAGTLDVEQIVRDVTLAEYYYNKLSSVYDFKSFTFIGNSSSESLLDRTGRLHEPQRVYAFEDSSSSLELSLVSFERETAEYAFRITDKRTGQVRDHFVEVPGGKSASIGTLFDREKNRGHLVSISMQCLTIGHSLTPDALATFLKEKNTIHGAAPPAKFKPSDQRWMDELFGPGKMELDVAASMQADSATGAQFVHYDTPPEPLGGMRALAALIKYPKSALMDSTEGQVVVEVLIDETGRTSEWRVIKAVRNDLDSAAVNALREVLFIPARIQGRAVAVRVAIPIAFRLK
jgi:TonB family protein